MGDYILIEQISFNERSLISWYDKTNKFFQFALFHLTEQPNTPSKLSPESPAWGYATFVSQPILDPNEITEITALYIVDLMEGNNWWESDDNLIITDDLKERLEALELPEEPKEVVRNFTVIQGGE